MPNSRESAPLLRSRRSRTNFPEAVWLPESFFLCIRELCPYPVPNASPIRSVAARCRASPQFFRCACFSTCKPRVILTSESALLRNPSYRISLALLYARRFQVWTPVPTPVSDERICLFFKPANPVSHRGLLQTYSRCGERTYN